MFVKRVFEIIYNAIESIADTKYEKTPENKKVFNYGFKHNKTVEVDKYKLRQDR